MFNAGAGFMTVGAFFLYLSMSEMLGYGDK
jgi:hypothetical protein